jgi:hypothetical protein
MSMNIGVAEFDRVADWKKKRRGENPRPFTIYIYASKLEGANGTCSPNFIVGVDSAS